MRPIRLSLASALLCLACASAHDPVLEPAGPRGNTKSLTAADIEGATQLDLLDLIVAERPQWLRAPDGKPAPVIVYLGDARLGGPATLKGLTLNTIGSVRYFETSAAQQRFSSRDFAPVIQVVLKARGGVVQKGGEGRHRPAPLCDVYGRQPTWAAQGSGRRSTRYRAP
jgi:hypothetical protein